jgi:hypothetical protein
MFKEQSDFALFGAGRLVSVSWFFLRWFQRVSLFVCFLLRRQASEQNYKNACVFEICA